ncbi:hypothetical protein CJ030_MR4G025310 [Morella rubra]|uniref:Late embryogenesis abundant protein LEA-2 subgroup domain-containing protein n=1 Tax=Morella rubra TaxID=262757 RepID=A0A6A1VXU5_9ROSI|nr:hypothetical protein CJ030_MR4G025310 [Morella rubra]
MAEELHGVDHSFKDEHEEQRRVARSSKCPVCILALFVILCITILVFAKLVLSVKSPNVKLTSVTVEHLRYGNAPSPSFIATMVAEMTVENRNFGNFEFQNGLAYVKYGGVTFGKWKIGDGVANGKSTKKMTIKLDVMSNKHPASTLSNDINSRTLKFSSYAKLNGRVCSLKIIKKKTTAEMNCTMILICQAAGSKT